MVWKTNWKSYAIVYFQMHNCITSINFFHEHVAVILLSLEVSLDTLVFLCSPHPVLFSFVCEISSFDKFELVKVPQETLKLYSIWNMKKFLASENVGLTQCSPKNEKIPFFRFAHCGLRTKISFYKKEKEREKWEILIFMFSCGSLIYLFVSSSYINVKDFANNSHLFNL